MKILARIVLGCAIVAVAAVGVLWMLVGFKEGSSLEELPYTIAGLLGAVGLAVVWWYAVGRSLALAVPMWLILALPGLLAAQQSLSLGVGLVVGLRLEREAVIESYAEEPIVWPGFDGPVGMTVRFDLIHPDGTDGLILGPEIRMGPALDIPRSALHATQRSYCQKLTGR